MFEELVESFGALTPTERGRVRRLAEALVIVLDAMIDRAREDDS